jgi:CheY-like chemotaxis protein
MSETTGNDYKCMAEGVIRNYVRSVLFIDDEWPEIQDLIAEGEQDESHLIPPEAVDDIEPEVSPEVQRMVPDIESKDRAPRCFSAKCAGDSTLLEFRQAVKKEGILFTGLRYHSRDLFESTVKLAQRADIIILDWELMDDDGAEAIRILKSLQNGGLRFICIFTDKDKVEEVRERLIRQLDNGSVGQALNTPELRLDDLIIVIRNKKKPDGEAPDKDSNPFAIEPGKLLGEAIHALSVQYGGLVQLAILEMTTKHREHIPRILGILTPALDPAFLLEKTDGDSPISRSDAFLGLLVDE